MSVQINKEDYAKPWRPGIYPKSTTEAEFLAGNTKGEGTLAKPFTDTVTAYVAGVPLFAAYIKTSGVAYPSTTGGVRDIVLPA